MYFKKNGTHSVGVANWPRLEKLPGQREPFVEEKQGVKCLKIVIYDLHHIKAKEIIVIFQILSCQNVLK